MVFAGGKGTRLRPFTDHKPKALVEVGGEPMLKRVIDKLRAAGICEIVVNVHHFADQIKEFLASDRYNDIEIHISDESDMLLETGGGILKAARWLEDGSEPFLVHNADILTDFSLTEMVRDHISHGRDITLLCDRRSTSRYLLMDTDMRMHGWTNVNTEEVKPATLDARLYDKYAFGGVHIMQPGIIEDLRRYCIGHASEAGARPDHWPFSIISFFVEYCRKLNIGGYRPHASYNWHDIGKPESLERANKLFFDIKDV